MLGDVFEHIEIHDSYVVLYNCDKVLEQVPK